MYRCVTLLSFISYIYVSIYVPSGRGGGSSRPWACWLPWVDDAWWPTWHSRCSRRWKKRWKDGRITFSIELEGMKHHETSMFFSTCQWTQHGAKKMGSGKSRIQSWTAGKPGMWPFVMIQACAKGVPVRNLVSVRWLKVSQYKLISVSEFWSRFVWNNATKYNEDLANRDGHLSV